ncbi:uncharacterized protein LOC130761475 [Actinidia eriantha]|uniref:uncharacterized protein LOC130761475 n=1 Tax=Actinidia eriantha TaxID=165200 RepID=UPI002585E15F|nr:uncharacterized protein LOC130761475 [Actinidia eriantha]
MEFRENPTQISLFMFVVSGSSSRVATGLFHRGNGYKIGKDLGTPICVDHNVLNGKILWGKVMRIRVIIDIRNPLKTGFQLRRNGLPDIWVDFKYQTLSQFCYSCGRIGHVFRTCKFSTSNAKFGPSMRAMPMMLLYLVITVPGLNQGCSIGGVEVCTSLVALPPPMAIMKQSMSEEILLFGSTDMAEAEDGIWEWTELCCWCYNELFRNSSRRMWQSFSVLVQRMT